MNAAENAPLVTVGQAARAAGITPKAARLYEAKGLLPRAERSDAGYRLYTDDDIATLRFIRQARTLGLRLDEVSDILDTRRDGTAPCHHVLRLIDQHVGDIDRTIGELRQLRAALVQTRKTAAQATTGDVCGIIEHAG